MKILLEHYESRYQKDINREEWTEEELGEMGHFLSLEIERDQARKVRANARISFLWNRIQTTITAQDDLGEVGTETEDFHVDPTVFGYRPKDVG